MSKVFAITIALLAVLASGTAPEAPATKAAATYRDEKRYGANTCSHAFDGDCDDGGLGSEYSLCRSGTDESDCGSNACAHSNDGDCDDGGAGSEYSFCVLNSDRNDCYSRRPFSRRSGICSNSCSHSHDRDCDDGGYGSEYSLCHIGSDCSDCGSRSNAFLQAEAQAIDQRAFPSIREQKLAKIAHAANANAMLGAAAVVGLAALVAAGVIVKRRTAKPGAATPDAGPASPNML